MAAAKNTKASKSQKAATVPRRGKRTWSRYVHRSLKNVNAKLTISSKAMKIMNSFVGDMFDRIANEAATLARVSKRRTLKTRDMQTAVRLSLPAELGKHAMAEGAKATAKLGL